MANRPFVCAITACLICLTGVLPGADLASRQAVQWSSTLEWSVHNPSWTGNAFDVRASVVFRHQESGETCGTEMFFAGDKTWAFRFTGTRSGVWTFWTSSDDEDLQGHTGNVTIQPNPNKDAHGFLRKSRDKWGWQGTENAFVPQLVQWDYIAGDSNPKLFHQNPALIDQKIEEFIDAHGFSGFHVPVIAGRWFDLDAEVDRIQAGKAEPDVRTFEALELLITRTHQAGAFVHIWAWGDHQRGQTPRSLEGGIGGVIDRRLQRYIAARLGPIPGWTMGYGFDLDEWVTAEQVRDWRDFMHAHLGWAHFLGGRPAGPNLGLDHAADAQWNQGLDYSSYEHHRPTYDVYLAAMQATSGQPVMSEDRFRVRPPKYPEKDYSLELTRRGLYHSTMAGGVANIWGIHPDLSPGGVYPNKDQIKTYSVCFHDKGRFLADMVVANGLSADTDTRVLLSPGSQSLVLYRENTETLQIDLSSLSDIQPAMAVDTRQVYAEIPLGDLKPEVQTIRLPRPSDWVVVVGHFRPHREAL
jgi:hypothetical protein